MKRTDIQKRIIPRNWLFGRIAFTKSNLSNILKHSKSNFTQAELDKISHCIGILSKVLIDKTEQAEVLKKQIIDERST